MTSLAKPDGSLSLSAVRYHGLVVTVPASEPQTVEDIARALYRESTDDRSFEAVLARKLGLDEETVTAGLAEELLWRLTDRDEGELLHETSLWDLARVGAYHVMREVEWREAS